MGRWDFANMISGKAAGSRTWRGGQDVVDVVFSLACAREDPIKRP